MKDLCACVNFMVLGIKFNFFFYSHSNCAIAILDPGIDRPNFHSFQLIQLFQWSAVCISSLNNCPLQMSAIAVSPLALRSSY